ncbi:hypothetical protein [Kitasatospora sp. NPDC051914]|uniref:hypothetical protein n=1 Tax=Kitasatospora sp. NPDC051914 TaxID=3154945 RepID=UPI00342E54B6
MRKSLPALLVAAAIAATAAGTTTILPTASSTVAPAQRPASQQTPAPHIHGFARGLKASPEQLPTSASPVPQEPGSDGCDHAYGTAGQCVPWVFPPGVGSTTRARCAWLTAHGLGELQVHGRDRMHLDRNRDGIICGRDD